MNCAACPLEAATAATPPSRAAILFSKTSWGFECERLSLESRFITYQGRIPDTTVNVAKGFQTKERRGVLVQDMLESVTRGVR